ncbi:hypothetical protein DFJ58DRAFT_681978 [Suillus subalutaceus]|uniref:uncharacterized protein n=1 Tax=Suillus subalutaceus TaxID=48586 RepID=UPI001B87B3F9|nr:uncharacterized protein DFJ58DRAFT_681978 [Suillus subalutaceus]KAG1860240.1 hypothetical protein DFJ58DRAFT_681978 [Suillus subalutaceus]
MYRGSSPASDEPEFQPLRRLKPLPKRRRTSDAPIPAADDLVHPMADILGAESLADELIAHADSSLQSYYASVFGGTRNGDTLDLNAAYQLGKMGKSEEDQSEGDYTDHFQQPGNTKKRKVPANMSGAAQGREAEPQLGAEDEILDSLALLHGRANHGLDLSALPPSVTPTPRKGKITASTLAGLQHKELLKHRKRQLAAVLGALSLGDTLALDQALSTHLPFAGSMIRSGSNPPKLRLSRRPGPRLARAAKARASTASMPLQKKPSFPTTQFVFTFSSATSDRLVATKQEVLALRNRFENELARQAAKVAKGAADTKQAALTASKGTKSKRGEKTQQRALKGAAESGDQSAEFLEMPGGKGKGSKKKKRNAIAIASNPHHRKNYVPSRLPSSGQANVVQANANAQNMLGPLPLRFLSAQIPPRRRKKANTVTPTAQIVNPADEWICPRCEYSLFYGEGSEYRQAVKNRKHILRRRRRAQERAAGGLNASKTPANLAPSDEEDDYDNDYEPSPAQSPVIVRESDWKEGPDIGRSRGQDFIQTG